MVDNYLKPLQYTVITEVEHRRDQRTDITVTKKGHVPITDHIVSIDHIVIKNHTIKNTITKTIASDREAITAVTTILKIKIIGAVPKVKTDHKVTIVQIPDTTPGKTRNITQKTIMEIPDHLIMIFITEIRIKIEVIIITEINSKAVEITVKADQIIEIMVTTITVTTKMTTQYLITEAIKNLDITSKTE